jgi:gluconate 2-dehydrogenase gamma chain
MISELSRRTFLLRAGTGISAAWVSANWPALLSAAKHARHAAQATKPPKLEFFTPEQAIEIDAISARIIPTDDMPGAREAGVVYFIDRGLATFSAGDQKTYREGLPELQARVSEIFPDAAKFSALTPEQQDEVLHSFDERAESSQKAIEPGEQVISAHPVAKHFFETLRQHTIAGFLIDPDYGGNDSGAGWKVIGREREHLFQPPFGYYDKDYPGWQAMPKEAEKK